MTEVIHTTATHPWLTADRGWLVAGALHIGEPVRLLDGGTATVVALHALPGVGPMWDLALDSVHTFAVGAVQAVVHNCPVGNTGGAFTRNAQGELTNGTYTVSKAQMASHLPGSAIAGKSVCATGYDAEQGVLNAAEYADQNGLWTPLNKATVDMGQPVGVVNPGGIPTTWMTVVRRFSGYIHGYPDR